MASYIIELLGVPRVRDAGGEPVDLPVGKPFALLVYVAVEDRAVPRDELAGLFWPDAPRDRARQSLRQALWLLRKHLESGIFASDDPVDLDADRVGTDLDRFRALLEAGHIEEARDLWRGPFMDQAAIPGSRAWDRWIEERRNRLARRLSRALSDLGMRRREVGRAGEAVEILAEAVSLDPLSVAAHRELVQAHLDCAELDAAREALAGMEHHLGDQEVAADALDELRERLRALTAAASRDESAEREPPLEFVGRAEELAELRAAWKLARGGSTRVALISGPSGIGKTRLAREVYLLAASEGARGVRVKAHRDEATIRWGIVADLVRQLARLPGAAGVAPATDATLQALVPPLGSTSGKPRLTGVQATALAEALVDLVEAVSFEGPLVITVDDVHWADPESQRVLLRAIRRLRRAPCLVLLTERTSPGPAHETPLARSAGTMDASMLQLGPLAPGEVVELLAMAVSFSDLDDASEVGRQIHRTTGGNPLFIGEVLRKLARDGAIEKADEGWHFRAGGLPPDIPLPERVEAVIRERFKRVSSDARAVAATLALQSGRSSRSSLRRKSGLNTEAFASALRELVDEGIVWEAGGSVDFSHDQLREVARKHLAGTAGRRRRTRRRIVAYVSAAVVVGLLAAMPLFMTVVGGDAPEGPTHPFGEGRLLLVGEDEITEVIPPDVEGGEWAVRPSSLERPDSGVVRGAYRTTSGDLFWLADIHGVTEAPYVVRIAASDGGTKVLLRTPGDDGTGDAVASGDRIALLTENLETEIYDRMVVVVDSSGANADTIYRGAELLGLPDWSPDGQRIVFRAYGPTDTLVSVAPDGSHVVRKVFEGIRRFHGPTWCADSRHLAIRARVDGRPRAAIYDTEADTLTVLTGESALSVTCIGSARALASSGIRAAGRTLLIHDLRTDSTWEIPVRPLGVTAWIPDRITPAVRTVTVEPDTLTIRWGEKRVLAAEGRRSSGDTAPVEVEWTSADPGIASVSPSGEVSGNRRGVTTVAATYREWLADTVLVRVAGEVREDVLFRPDLGADLEEGWTVHAHPRPRPLRRAGESILSLEGDGRYPDLVLSREGFDLAQGATLEFDVRMPLTRRDRQRVTACLMDVEDTSLFRDSITAPARFLGPGACLGYPTGQLAHLQEDRAFLHFNHVGIAWDGPLPPATSTDEWTHMALQVRPDGKTSVWVDRHLVLESEIPLLIEPGSRWHVRLQGAAVDTELLVRNLTLWRGTRYQGGR